MAAPVLADEVADDLGPAYAGVLERKLAAALLAPLQPMVDILLDERGSYASVFDGTITDPRPLGWGAQWGGTDPSEATLEQLRSPAYIRRRWIRGSVTSVLEAIRGVLTGDKLVKLYERRDSADLDTDDPYHLTIVAKLAEAPGGEESIRRALRSVLPARIMVDIVLTEGPTWQDIIDDFATWQDVIDEFDTWQDVMLYEP